MPPANVPYSRFFIPGNIQADAPAGPQQITSRNFGINWAPADNADGSMSSRSTVFNELENYNFRNLRVRYNWAQQEPTDQGWNWTRVDADFADLTASNLRSGKQMKMIILLELSDSSATNHGTDDHVVPPFIRDDPITGDYQGGEWEYQLGNSPGQFGFRIRAWNQNVKAKMIRYATALIDHIKETPAWYAMLEGVGYTETADGGAQIPIDKNAYAQALRDCISNLRAQMPTKMVYQRLNSPRNQLYSWVNHLKNNVQGCIWGPDVFPDKLDYWFIDNNNPPTNRGIYRYYDMETTMCRFIDVQTQDYQWTADPAQKKAQPTIGHQPTIQELYDFAVARGCHYLTWFRDAAVIDGLPNRTRVLNFMNINGSPQKTLLTGGMNTTIPANYL